MSTDIGKTLRIADFIDAGDGRGLLLDTSIASCLGATPGLENLGKVLDALNYSVDGIIVNPGTAERHADLLGGKKRAAPLIRVDWTNAFRDDHFCLSRSTFRRLHISDAEDARKLGASGVVAGFFMGFGDDAEAENIKTLSHLARECSRMALPLVVDILPLGDKIDRNNFETSVTLGVSFMQELGADALIIPETDAETRMSLREWICPPVLLRLDTIPTVQKLTEIVNDGCAGLVLSEKVLAAEKSVAALGALRAQLHEVREKDGSSTG